MREILYVQAGNFANYIGTHFWNAQDCYLSEHDGDAESGSSDLHDSEVSFRKGSGNSVSRLFPSICALEGDSL